MYDFYIMPPLFHNFRSYLSLLAKLRIGHSMHTFLPLSTTPLWLTQNFKREFSLLLLSWIHSLIFIYLLLKFNTGNQTGLNKSRVNLCYNCTFWRDYVRKWFMCFANVQFSYYICWQWFNITWWWRRFCALSGLPLYFVFVNE